MKKFFVYGTLMQKLEGFNPILPRYGATYVGEASVEGYIVSCGGFPGLFLKDGNALVHGELWEMPDDHPSLSEMQHRLDCYEGYREDDPKGGLYDKEIVQVRVEDDEGNISVHDATLYTYNGSPDGMMKVGGGDWAEYRQGSPF